MRENKTRAAVARHTTMAWLCAAPMGVVLTPDITSEQPFWPEPASNKVELRHSGAVMSRLDSYQG